jgi:hypothetical protein
MAFLHSLTYVVIYRFSLSEFTLRNYFFLALETTVAEAPRQPLSRCNAGQASRSAFQIARTIMAERVRIVVARNRRQQRQATLTSEVLMGRTLFLLCRYVHFQI